jgi:hypothetical protein
MRKKNQKSQIDFSTTTHTPISFSSVRTSPIPREAAIFQLSTGYKSPHSTPTGGTTNTRPSLDSYLQCLSEQKQLKPGDSLFKLKQKLKLKEKQIQLLEEENKKLLKLKNSEKWEKELIKRNEEVRKLEVLVGYLKEIASKDSDSFKLLQIVETQSRKIAELEIIAEKFKDFRNDDLFCKVSLLEAENLKLKKGLQGFERKAEMTEELILKIEEMEKEIREVNKEKLEFMEELARIKCNQSNGSITYVMQDVWKIRKEVSKLLRVADDLHRGKEISLRGLLGIEVENFHEPSLQLMNDLQKIKADLNCISLIIAEVHASQSADLVCRSQ